MIRVELSINQASLLLDMLDVQLDDDDEDLCDVTGWTLEDLTDARAAVGVLRAELEKGRAS